jgi:hypothetical protein
MHPWLISFLEGFLRAWRRFKPGFQVLGVTAGLSMGLATLAVLAARMHWMGVAHVTILMVGVTLTVGVIVAWSFVIWPASSARINALMK